jgi:hypothetical protein
MSSFSHGIGAISAATCLLLTVGPRPDRQGPQQASPNVQTITVDFRALSLFGSPIVDLAAADVTVLVAGQPRAVQSLELVRDADDVTTMPEPVGPKTLPAAVLPAPFATNARPGRGRTFYFLVDEASMTADDRGSIQPMIEAFLANLPASDEVAVATTPPGAARVPPTTDRARVRGAFDGLTGLRSSAESPASVSARSASGLSRLDQLLGALRGSAQPPVIIVVSAGFSVPRPTKDAAVVSPVNLAHVRLAAAATRAELYFVQLPGQRPAVPATAAAGGSTAVDREAALRAIANDVGGDVLPLQASDNVFTRIARETSSHYVVSLSPRDGDRPGTAYPIAIASGRARMVLRFLPDTFLGGPPAQAPRTTQEMAAGVDEFRQVPIRLAGLTSRAGARDGAKVLITTVTEPVDSTERFTAATAVLLNGAGARVSESTAEPGGFAVTPIVSRLLAPPGHYLLRVAVVDAVGRLGTAECPIDASLTNAGPLMLSSLELGVARPPMRQGPVPGGRGDSTSGPEPRLEFTNEAEASAFFDLYGGTANEHVTVVMEVLKKAEGPPIRQLQPEIRPALVGEPDHYLVIAPIDLTDLSPGDYLIRATVGVTGQTPAVITRTLRKVKAGTTR